MDMSVLTIQEQGPDFWTGGEFGPEAGLVALTVALLGPPLIVLWVRWRYGDVGFGRLYDNMWHDSVTRDS